MYITYILYIYIYIYTKYRRLKTMFAYLDTCKM